MSRLFNRLLSLTLGFSMLTIPMIARSTTDTRSPIQRQLLAQATPPNTPQAKLLIEAMTLIGSRKKNDYYQAIEKLNQALKLYRSAKDTEGEKTVLFLLRQLYLELGDSKKAEEYLNQLTSNTFTQQTFTQQTPTNINYKYLALYQDIVKFLTLGDYVQALNSVNRLSATFPGDKKIESSLSFIKVIIYYSLGSYQEALSYLDRVKYVSNIESDKDLLRTKNLLKGNIYYHLGEYHKALNYFNQYKLIREKEIQQQELMFCKQIINQSAPNREALIKLNQEQCNWIRKSEENEDLSLILLADINNKLGNNQQALILYKEALDSLYQKKARIVENSNIISDLGSFLLGSSPQLKNAQSLSGIGKVYKELGNNQQALTSLNQALTIYQSINNKSAQPDLLFDLAQVHRSESKLNQALTEIEAAIKIVEDVRRKIVNPDVRTSYFASIQKYYRLKIDLLMQLHQQEPTKGYNLRALEAAESARARGLLDLLTEAKADIKQGVDPQLLAQERAIQTKLNLAEKRRVDILSRNQTIPPELEQEYTSLNQQYDQNKDQIRLKSPRYAAITQPQPLKIAQIQQLLDDNTVLLEYSLGEKQSYLWLVTKNSVNSYQLGKSADIKNIVDKYLSILTRRGGYSTAKIQIDKIAPQLKATLFGAVADKLTNKRLVVVADGALQYLPFGSLPIAPDNQPLLLTNEVINLPSASTLSILRTQNSTPSQAAKTVAIFADPVFANNDERITNIKVAKKTELSTEGQSLQRAARENGIRFERLTNTKTEAEAILKLVPVNRAKLNLDFAANIVNASKPELTNYRIIHFATHGLMDGLDPTRSGLVLSLFNERGIAENGYLRLQNIFNLKLDADLVVLSACQTGIGKEVQGEGLVGLTRGFMYAGTPRVVVSLWSVDDRATALLMSKFYTGILNNKLTPAAALRQAQLEMMRDPKYQSPYYWAAFTLQGEWK